MQVSSGKLQLKELFSETQQKGKAAVNLLKITDIECECWWFSSV